MVPEITMGVVIPPAHTDEASQYTYSQGDVYGNPFSHQGDYNSDMHAPRSIQPISYPNWSLLPNQALM
jgi:hypothetical protein